jgi:hypothetical protein
MPWRVGGVWTAGNAAFRWNLSVVVGMFVGMFGYGKAPETAFWRPGLIRRNPLCYRVFAGNGETASRYLNRCRTHENARSTELFRRARDVSWGCLARLGTS